MTALTLAGAALLAAGYLIGRARPLRTVRTWADGYLAWAFRDTGRLAALRRAAVLGEETGRALWRRARTGQWPHPPPRQRVSPVPVRVLSPEERAARRTAQEEP